MTPAALPGAGLVRLDVVGTAVFAVVAVAAAVDPSGLGPVAVAVDLVLFALGCALALVGYGRAVVRSRDDDVQLAALYGLAGAPPAARRALFGALAAQVVVAVATAAVRPFTVLAFGILVPMLGVGALGLWGAHHVAFAPRPPPVERRRPAAGRRPTRGPGPGPAAGGDEDAQG